MFTPGVEVGVVVGFGVGGADGVGVGVADGVGVGDGGRVTTSGRGVDALLVSLDEDSGEDLEVDPLGEAGRSVIFTSFKGFGDSVSG